MEIKTVEFKKWQKIGQFHNIRKSIRAIADYKRTQGEDVLFPIVTYRGKVKLDGTNAAIRVTQGRVAAQSRSRMITADDDNYGFAAFVDSIEDWVRARDFGVDDLTIYGEWCGLGIQKRCSVSRCDRMFVVFAACLGDSRLIEPSALEALLGERPEGVHVLDWHGDEIVVDYACEDSVDAAVNAMCEAVAAVERCDPWVKNMFNQEGLGEGLVYYPLRVEEGRGSGTLCVPDEEDLLFKAKGEEHKNVIQLKPVLKDPEVVASIAAFVTKFVTEDRMQQGLTELGISEPSARDTGSFLKWIGNDIKSESADELEVAGLTWSAVAKEVARAAKSWFFAKL
jgi:hypothetical protein